MTANTHKFRGRPARALMILIAVLLLVAGGVTISEQSDPPDATTSTTSTSTTTAAAALSRSATESLARAGCPRPTDPPKDAKALRDVAEPLRSYMNTAIVDARSVGLSLVLVSGGRADSQQWDLRHERVPGHECDPAYKGKPQTALPGKSRHRNTGKIENGKLVAAADMGGALSWLHARSACYGIHFPVNGEYWHVEVTGRAPTCTIIPFNAPVPRWITFGPGDTDRSVMLRGGLGTEITEAQLILTHLGYRPGLVDGRYGPATQAAVTRFKRDVVNIQRATGQPVWPNTDSIVGPATIAGLRWWNQASSRTASFALAA